MGLTLPAPPGARLPAPAARVIAAAAISVALVAPPAPAEAKARGAVPAAATRVPRDATAVVRRTSHGVPHVRARSWRGAGVGVGYAQAQDAMCILADVYVTVSGRRAQTFGAGESYLSPGNGIRFNNLKSDFAYQRINDLRLVEKLVAEPPPAGPTAEVRALVEGFAAGYNKRLADIGGPEGISDPACKGAAWVRPITALDVYRRVYAATGLASFQFFTEGLVDARPPLTGGGAGALTRRLPTAADAARLREALPGPQRLRIGSNAYALGRRAVEGGSGMMLANPHFPWRGTERFYQFQLTVPGKVDVTGASLLGFPTVNVGHTAGVAWTHTVSTAYRFTPYELTLVPGDPTSYIVDGQVKRMTPRRVTVPLRDGQQRSHTFYETQWGPMLHFPGAFLYWTPLIGYALADANATNFRVLNAFVAMNKAQSTKELRAAQHRHQGIPWVNTLAADRDGNAYYADDSVVPNVPDDLAAQCVTGALGRAIFAIAGLPILDGSRSSCAWRRDADAAEPGIFGPRSLPRLVRADYVTNHNDSHWLSNPEEPLTGFARIIGDEETQRSLRTRVGLTMIRERFANSDGLGGRRFTLPKLQALTFGNRFFSGELFRGQVVEMCRTMGGIDTAACDALANWDLKAEIDSRGTLLWQEFMGRALAVRGGPYADAFDPKRPVDTPSRLRTESPLVQDALRQAAAHLAQKKISFATRWGDVHYVTRNGDRIPIHGCQGPAGFAELGCFNHMGAARRDDGSLEPVYATSFVMATTWKNRRVFARTILAHSQSADPTSPWYSDQTRMFLRKRWIRDRFTNREIAADPRLTVKVLRDRQRRG